ncbi:MAG: hypothetical protein EA394_08790 [Bacteroidia bacterium]|nr:MAG: hypothetical protein EA394_08790 [Bacteroidia bacterium]
MVDRTYIQRKLLLLLIAMLLSGCVAMRDTPARPPGMPATEVQTYSRTLGMPLSGRENPVLIKEVAGWTGTPYRYGGNTRSGVDCSGFVWALYRDVYGTNIARTTRDQSIQSRRISRRNLQEGDLLFFRTKGRSISHVGIYLGNGYFAHASKSRGVIVSSLTEDYYNKRFARGGRVRPG